MVENEKENGFMEKIRDGLSYVSQMISASIFPPIADGAEMIMKKIEERMNKIEKRILRKMSFLMIIGFGATMLIFAFLFFLIENLRWSKASAFFSIGITIFVIGLMLKVWDSER